jgi:NADH-quinone oxidoreductase subunit N
MTPNYTELFLALLPEAALTVAALLVLGYDLVLGRKRSDLHRLRAAAALGLLGVVTAAFAAFGSGVNGPAFGAVVTLDSLGLVTRLGVLLLSALTMGMVTSLPRLRHPAEYVAVILFATIGFTLMAVAQQLLIAFLALELASLSLYVLTGFDKTRIESAEAGLKYYLFGGMSAAFLLFGFSLLYGLTGSIELNEIALRLRTLPADPLLIVALVMVLVAFGFKAAAAPFHLWAPDVYQGAPAPSAALIASASKLAGFTLFGRLLWAGFAPAAGDALSLDRAGTPGWVSVAVVISAVSLVLGNLGALAQSNVRRLLAYSAIAHAGALLLGVIVGGSAGPAPLFYYAATYGLATVGAFGVIAVVDGHSRCNDLSDLAGLYRRSPLLAGCLFVFILSLAGIPPLAGFFGKFVVFAFALKINGLAGPAGWLALLAIAMSAVSLYYYVLILKQALVVRSETDDSRITVPLGPAAALGLAASLIVALGLFPSVVLRMIQ